MDADGNIAGCSSFYRIEEVSEWLFNAGFSIRRILEPIPVDNPPYSSPAWELLRPQLENFPATVIYIAGL
jgi:hypothetical protein